MTDEQIENAAEKFVEDRFRYGDNRDLHKGDLRFCYRVGASLVMERVRKLEDALSKIEEQIEEPLSWHGAIHRLQKFQSIARAALEGKES